MARIILMADPRSARVPSLLRDGLASKGHTVSLVRTAEEVAALLVGQAELPDLIVVDWMSDDSGSGYISLNFKLEELGRRDERIRALKVMRVADITDGTIGRALAELAA